MNVEFRQRFGGWGVVQTNNRVKPKFRWIVSGCFGFLLWLSCGFDNFHSSSYYPGFGQEKNITIVVQITFFDVVQITFLGVAQISFLNVAQITFLNVAQITFLDVAQISFICWTNNILKCCTNIIHKCCTNNILRCCTNILLDVYQPSLSISATFMQ